MYLSHVTCLPADMGFQGAETEILNKDVGLVHSRSVALQASVVNFLYGGTIHYREITP